MHYSPNMELDLRHFAAVKTRRRARGDMNYLLAAARRELAQRWAAHKKYAAGAEGATGNARREILVMDFARTELFAADNARWRSALGESGSGDMEPQARLENHALDAMILCLQPAWLDWPRFIRQALSLLRADGILLFCTFGPDTLAQVRWAWQQADTLAHVHPFADMRDLGDQLARAGFVNTTLDADRLTVAYPDADTLFCDLRGAGFTNILTARRKTLTGKTRARRFRAALASLHTADQPLNITFEFVYGFARAPQFAVPVRAAPANNRD